MVNYVEYLGLPASVAIGIIFAFFVLQAIGEILEFKGKIVPEVLKVRKYFARKRKERESMKKVFDLLPSLQNIQPTLDGVQNLLASVNAHYSEDNIAVRDAWISHVNKKLEEAETAREENRISIKNLESKLDKNNEDTLSLLIDNKRSAIINFADLVIDENKPVTREQFNRIFKLYEEYENIIYENDRTNGEVDIAIRIIRESYEKRVRTHSFVEDVRGYNL